jgi:hypothetical protein
MGKASLPRSNTLHGRSSSSFSSSVVDRLIVGIELDGALLEVQKSSRSSIALVLSFMYLSYSILTLFGIYFYFAQVLSTSLLS